MSEGYAGVWSAMDPAAIHQFPLSQLSPTEKTEQPQLSHHPTALPPSALLQGPNPPSSTQNEGKGLQKEKTRNLNMKGSHLHLSPRWPPSQLDSCQAPPAHTAQCCGAGSGNAAGKPRAEPREGMGTREDLQEIAEEQSSTCA